MKVAAVITTLVSLFSFNAFADSLVSCKTTARTPVTVMEYVIKSSPSQRLNSPIFYTNSAGLNVYDQSSVAQYKTTAVDLFVSVDDASEGKVLQLFAIGSRNKFLGAVSEFNAAGAISKNIVVKCEISAL